jgi:hypothetical protein
MRSTDRPRLRRARLLCAAWLGSALWVFAPATALPAAGLTVASASSTATSSATLSLLIPGVIGIDVESDVAFDLTTLSAAASPSSCTNVFPAGASCSSAVLSPTSVTTTSGATPAPASGSIYLALLDSTSTSVATKNVKASVASAWTGTSPGVSTTALQTQRAGSNNGGVGNAAFAALPTVPTALANSSSIPSGPFVWVRQDQTFRLVIPSSQNPSATGNATVVVTYTFSRS